jgi:hypothetical protein
MPEPVTLTWTAIRDPQSGKVYENEGIAYDGEIPVGRVWLVSGDPFERGAWRWSMFGYARYARSPTGLKRSGAAATKDQAKAESEWAYTHLLAADPGNRQAIHDHHADMQESRRLYETGEGLRRPQASIERAS